MTISGLSIDSYVSPYGAEAIKRQVCNSTATIENQPDSFVKKHKKKDNTSSTIFNALLTMGALFGIYKGRNNIKPALNTINKYSGKLFNKINQSPYANNIFKGAVNIAGTIGKGAKNLKNKITANSYAQKIASLPAKMWNGIKTLASKIHK